MIIEKYCDNGNKKWKWEWKWELKYSISHTESIIVNEVIRTIFFFLQEHFISIKSINKRLSFRCTL